MLAVSKESVALDSASSTELARPVSFLKPFPPILAEGLPNLIFLVFVSFLIGRKLVIFICPELVEPVGEAGALRNAEMFFEQQGIISSSKAFVVFMKKLVSSFSNG